MNIIKSIINIKFYNEIYKKNIWKNILYAFILSLLVYYAGVFVNLAKLGVYVNTSLGVFVSNLPEFTINEGKLDVKTEKPLVFESEGFAFVVDDKNTISLSKYSKYGVLVYFGEQSIIMKSGVNTRELKYKSILGNFKLSSINKSQLLILLPYIKGTIIRYAIVLYILWYLLWLPFYKIWSIIILSIIAMIVDSILKTGLTYRGLFNISLYAITLPWITKVLYKSIGIDNYINGFFFFIIYWSIATAYVYFAIKQIRKTELFSKDKSDDDFKVLETVEKVTEFTLD